MPTAQNQAADEQPSASIVSGDSSQSQSRRKRSGPKSKLTQFIGVSRYKRTGRWEVRTC